MDGISKYIQHISTQKILLRYWSLWFPVQCLNFAVVPEHLRVPFGACVSFFWMFLLSSISSQEEDAQQVSPQPSDSPISGSFSDTWQRARDEIILHPAYQQTQQLMGQLSGALDGVAATTAKEPGAPSRPSQLFTPIPIPVYSSQNHPSTSGSSTAAGSSMVGAPGQR